MRVRPGRRFTGALGTTAALLLLGTLLATGEARAWNRDPGPALDSIGIFEVHRDLIATRDGRSMLTIRLENHEDVVWRGARGRVGAVITDRRVLTVSQTSAGWSEVRIRDDEGTPIPDLGGRIAFVRTEKRLIWQPAMGSARVLRLGAGERVLHSDAGENLAIAVTNRRAIGVSGRLGVSSHRDIRARERFRTLQVQDGAGAVETSRRLLVFSGSRGVWTADPLPLR